MGQAEAALRHEDVGRRWSTDTRLRFLEARLFWEGQVNRADLMAAFKISVPQATQDLREYAALAPGNLVYDTRLKKYVAATEGFVPVFGLPNAEAWLETRQVTDEPEAVVEAVPLPHRVIDPWVLRRMVQARREGVALHLRYQAMDRPEAAWFCASPTRFVSDQFRWHVRMFNFDADRYEDWLFPRILEVGGERSAGKAPPDTDWMATIDIRMVPAGRLSPSQRDVVARDYGMVDGCAVIRVRIAMLFLFWRRMNLDRPDGLVDVDNRAEVEAMLEAMRLRYARDVGGPTPGLPGLAR